MTLSSVQERNTAGVRLFCAGSFDLGATLVSGQCFRWERVSGENENCVCKGIASDRAVTISQELSESESGSVITVTGDDRPDAEAFWRDYLDLDTDYDAIRREVCALEPRLAAAAERLRGLRILRQEPWEALCSFIISQNNNIPRIRSIIGRICALCAPRINGTDATDGTDGELPPFPTAEAVAALPEEALRAAGCGYRAPYVLGAARAAADGSFDPDALRKMPLDEARTALLSLGGVGPKVADCVLLYGLHRLECFPRDVWIRRALEGEFAGTKLPGTPFAGVAQQYIFEHIRARGKDPSGAKKRN